MRGACETIRVNHLEGADRCQSMAKGHGQRGQPSSVWSSQPSLSSSKLITHWETGLTPMDSLITTGFLLLTILLSNLLRGLEVQYSLKNSKIQNHLNNTSDNVIQSVKDVKETCRRPQDFDKLDGVLRDPGMTGDLHGLLVKLASDFCEKVRELVLKTYSRLPRNRQKNCGLQFE